MWWASSVARAVEVCATCAYPTIGAAIDGEVGLGSHDIELEVREGIYVEPDVVRVPAGVAVRVVGRGAVSLTSGPGGPIFEVGTVPRPGGRLYLENVTAAKLGNRVLVSHGGDIELLGGVYYSLGLTESGGVLSATGGSLVVNGTRFLASISAGDGGHLFLERTVASVADATFRGGFARDGGAVFVGEGSVTDFVTFTRCAFEGNEAIGNGGAIAVQGRAPVLVLSSTFEGNRADRGGAIGNGVRLDTPVQGSAVVVEDTTFVENEATDQGGAVYLDAHTGTLTRVSLLRNRARKGGAVSVHDRDLAIEESFLCRNEASVSGGAAWLEGEGTRFWRHDRVVDNVAAEAGGAVALSHGAALDLAYSNLLGNEAASGAAVHAPTLTEHVASVANLIAWSRGDAAIRLPVTSVAEARFTLSDTVFHGNALGSIAGPPLQPLPSPDPGLRAYQPGADCASLDDRYGPSSPLVDAGTEGDLDPDGTRADAGAWGGFGPIRPVDRPSVWQDGDGDGVVSLYDCDDGDAEIHPPVGPTDPEVWYDGLDQDCDGGSDYDQDRDGFDSADFPPGADCDDLDAIVNPGAGDVDGRDLNCDGAVDEDGDGYSPPVDCNDSNPQVHPDVNEDADLEVDRNCDLVRDPDGVLTPNTCSNAGAERPSAMWPAGLVAWWRRRRAVPVGTASRRSGSERVLGDGRR